jgi:NADH-quinone oxidoreductase subunit G
MEFLLINHPLDCPVCDQAGECELQDVSLDHGDYKSNYNEMKRTVIDKDIGSLVSTEMTRCIHCSRCVRFGEEVAGIKELGMTGRGEKTKIETFVNQSLTSELSGNVIDLCPVGALNNNLYKYSARTWDLEQKNSISSNDCLGSNIYYHTYKNSIKRAVPKENEQINLSWLSDRDRFGHEGIESNERILLPMIKRNNKLKESDLNSLYSITAEKIKEFSPNITAIMSAQSSCEEMYLFQKILRENGVSNIDHRTKECDFRYQANYPIIPSFDIKINDIANMDNIILINTNISKEFPILSIYLRDAIKKNSTNVFSLATYNYSENFDTNINEIFSPTDLVRYIRDSANNQLSNIKSSHKNLIILGPSSTHLKNYTEILDTTSNFAQLTNSKLALLGDLSNSSGAWAMGIIPHRLPGGIECDNNKEKNYESAYPSNDMFIVYNLEPEYDFSNDIEILDKLKKSKYNIFFSSYITDAIEKYADIVFPLAVQQEITGTYLNTNKQLQKSEAVILPKGKAEPGLDFLLNISKVLELDISIKQISEDINKILSSIDMTGNYVITENLREPEKKGILEKYIIRSPNTNNPTLRRCESLLNTHDADSFMSLPMDVNNTEDKKVTLIEHSKQIKINTNIKTHTKPENTIVVKVSGRYKQKLGSCNAVIDIE